MTKFILLFSLMISSTAFAQEFANPFVVAGNQTLSGLPTNASALGSCPRPGESESYEDMDIYLNSIQDDSETGTSGASSQ